MPAVYIQVYCMGNLHSMMNTGRPASHSRSHDCKSRVTPYSLIHVPHRRPTLVLREGERERAGGGGGGGETSVSSLSKGGPGTCQQCHTHPSARCDTVRQDCQTQTDTLAVCPEVDSSRIQAALSPL